MSIFLNVKKEDIQRLKNVQREQPKTIYEKCRASRDGVMLILYASGKLLLQGDLLSVKKVAEELVSLGIGEKEKASVFRKEEGWVIGSDETLKGDTFGGLVVAAVKADDALRTKLKEIGVADSKQLSDKEVLRIAAEVKKIVPCEIRSLLPEEYNQHHQKITVLLNKLHHDVGAYLAPGKHVVDKYPGCNVGDIMEEKAESKYIEVAAAPVLPPAAALTQLAFLSAAAMLNWASSAILP